VVVTSSQIPLLFAAAASVFFVDAAFAASLTVNECARLALEHAPAARSSRFQAIAAGQRVSEARAAFVPTFLGHGEYGRSEGFDEAVTNGGSTQTVLRMETTLLDGGQRGAQFRAAEARLRSATALEQQQRADIVQAVRNAYFTALASRDESRIHEQMLASLKDYVSLLAGQETLGAVPGNDVLRAKLSLATEAGSKRTAEAELSTSRQELASLTGVEIPEDSLAEPGELVVREADTAMVDASPVVSDATNTLEAAEREADAIRSERWGRMTFTGEAGAVGIRPRTTFQDNGGAQFLMGFDLPLFDGGVRASRLGAARAEAEAARAKVDEARRTVTLQLAQITTEAARAEAEVLSRREALPIAEKHFQLMRARHLGGGGVRLLEVLDSLGQYVEARVGLSRAELAYRLAVAHQAGVLGEGTP
jgi:outer membrane protein TolC